MIIGNVLSVGSAMYTARLGLIMAGIPHTTSTMSVNRLCASGLEAVSILAAKIKSGVVNVGIAGGVESMSLKDISNMVNPEELTEDVFEHE